MEAGVRRLADVWNIHQVSNVRKREAKEEKNNYF